MTNLDSMLKSSHYFADKGPSSQNYGFSSSHVGEGNGNQLQHSCLENPRDRSLVGCHLWGRTESDMTDVTKQQQQHVWMWESDCKKSWAPNNWCFWTAVLEKTLESPLDCKEIQPVHPKGNQFWIFIGRTDAEAETSILWPPDAKCWLIWKDLDAGKD